MHRNILKNRLDLFANNLLLASFFVYIFMLPFAQANINNDLFFNKINNFAIKGTFAIVILKDIYDFFTKKFSFKEIITYSILGIFFTLIYVKNNDAMPLLILLYNAGFKNEDQNKILVTSLVSLSISCVFIFILNFITKYGIQFVIHTRYGKERYRYTFGFQSPVTFHTYYLSILMLFLLVKKNVKLYELIFLFSINIFLFLFTDSKYPFILICLLLILYFIFNKTNFLFFKLFSAFTILLYPVGAIFSIVFTYMYGYGLPVLDFLNRLTTGRIALQNNGIKYWGINLFGSGANIFDTDKYGYCTIDSSYMYRIFVDGVAVLIIIIVFYMIFTYISYKLNEKVLVLVLFIIGLHSIFEAMIIYIDFHPILVVFSNLLILFNKKKYG